MSRGWRCDCIRTSRLDTYRHTTVQMHANVDSTLRYTHRAHMCMLKYTATHKQMCTKANAHTHTIYWLYTYTPVRAEGLIEI